MTLNRPEVGGQGVGIQEARCQVPVSPGRCSGVFRGVHVVGKHLSGNKNVKKYQLFAMQDI